MRLRSEEAARVFLEGASESRRRTQAWPWQSLQNARSLVWLPHRPSPVWNGISDAQLCSDRDICLSVGNNSWSPALAPTCPSLRSVPFSSQCFCCRPDGDPDEPGSLSLANAGRFTSAGLLHPYLLQPPPSPVITLNMHVLHGGRQTSSSNGEKKLEIGIYIFKVSLTPGTRSFSSCMLH